MDVKAIMTKRAITSNSDLKKILKINGQKIEELRSAEAKLKVELTETKKKLEIFKSEKKLQSSDLSN